MRKSNKLSFNVIEEVVDVNIIKIIFRRVTHEVEIYLTRVGNNMVAGQSLTLQSNKMMMVDPVDRIFFVHKLIIRSKILFFFMLKFVIVCFLS